MTQMDRLMRDIERAAEMRRFVQRMERRGYSNSQSREDRKPRSETA